MGEVRFGGYRLERLLGKGGMGQVWLAYDMAAARRVALKLLPAELAATGGYRKRFEREAEAVAQLRDPHVPRIHRFGEIDGRLYIDMQFVEGTDLARKLVAAGRMRPDVAVGIVGHVAVALDAAHRVGLVHRDVKPSNIVVHPSGFTYLIDFGIAHGLGQTAVTTTGMAIGTLAYMAPERFTGEVDGRADVYSLACVLYECLTGSRLYGDTDPAQQMHAHLMTAPPRAASVCADVPAALDAVIARGLAKDPNERFATAGEFAAAARAAIGAAVPDAVSPSAPSGEGRPKALTDEPAVLVPSPAEPKTKSGDPAAESAQDGRSQERAAAARSVPDAGDGLPRASQLAADSAAAARPAPTKVLPDPGLPPTLVATKLDWSVHRPHPAPQQHVPDPGRAVQAYSGTRLPSSGNGYPVAGQPYTAARPWNRSRSHPAAPVGHPGNGWQARLLALQSRVLSPRPVAPPPYSRPGVPARKVFPAVGRPAYPAVPQRRPIAPVLRRRPRRRRSLVSKVIGALIVVFLAPFAFAAGCVALIAAGSRAGDSGTPAATLPPSVLAEEHPGPSEDQRLPDPAAVAPVGTAVRDGKFEFVVTNVDAGGSRIGLQTAAGSFLTVTLAIRNISDEVKWFLPLGQRLVDAQGTPFDHNATATMWQNTRQGLGYSFELRPGQSATTQLVFDLPSNASPDHIELHDFVLSGGTRVKVS
ncbi:protein kinase [Nocardia amamiensis]|uniref:non-specific serine/threonine protein kinase n=1 Tax=Nocardia amamiensis TaxID=404578 RepID=A0ABS0CQ06_9NOCA|nr:serine/threonine-protein kinase [Nocardia amamiensis]MBF6298720.1 protein kinase [Nocardia amamiensis]